MNTTVFDVTAARERFSSLRSGFAFLDAPGGTQVPDEVGDAIARALRDASGNLGAPYATGRAVEAILEGAKADAARFLGCVPAEVAFGMNMTSLNFAISRAAGRDFEEGDEILTTELDHDGGVAPWVELAADKGMKVVVARATDELTVDYDDLESKLSDRTKVIAFALASNATGSVADAARICRLAREAGALSWIDAVHYAAHEPLDVMELGCDVLLCSPYKFCGPHLGMAYLRTEIAQTWRPYKARPSSSKPLGRSFETGTLPYELLAGFQATIAYLDSLGGLAPLRDYERALGERFLAGLPDTVSLYGPPTMEGRVPTFLLNVEGVEAETVARTLAERGYGVWYADNWYCVSLANRLPPSSVRVGFIHYNTAGEVDGLLGELAALAPS
ncbi:MAG TPA: aminotransferase class V-fold PLP-dependent enzyme [Gaiellaceae bacterium]|jgi:cysteine desulfurase family protein (TIGR01976 family)|nr:aminotransferase class V-fold PLP-dependent enzyme [Gaiellaceae bacterium]